MASFATWSALVEPMATFMCGGILSEGQDFFVVDGMV
jgi:hypothetical protein